MSLLKAYTKLLNSLEAAAIRDEEVTDTDVREAMALVLNYYFVWGKNRRPYPCTYRMFSRRGDRRVAKAIRRFLKFAASSKELAEISIGQARLDFLQNTSHRTPKLGMTYDDLMGYMEAPLDPETLPEDVYEKGEYD